MIRDRAYLYDNSAPIAERRLRGLEAIEDEATIESLRELGVSVGWHCLEIGAGAGSIARWLADTVQPSGRLVAADIDTQLLDTAAYEVRKHDIIREAIKLRSPPTPHCSTDLRNASFWRVSATKRARPFRWRQQNPASGLCFVQ